MKRLALWLAAITCFSVPALAQLGGGQIRSQSSAPTTCSTTPGVGELAMYYNTVTQTMAVCGPSPNTWLGGFSGGVLSFQNMGGFYVASSYGPGMVGGVCAGCISAALAVVPAGATVLVPQAFGTFTETAKLTLTKSVHLMGDGWFPNLSNGIIFDAGNNGVIESNNATATVSGVEIDHLHIRNSHVQAGGEFNNYAILARGADRWKIHDNYIDGPGHGIDCIDTCRDLTISDNWIVGATDYGISVVFNGEAITAVARNGSNVATITLGGQANVVVNEKVNVYGLGSATPPESAFNCTGCVVTAVTTGASPTISYANTGASLGTTTITGCSFGASCGAALNETDAVITGNHILAMTDSGIHNGPPEYITMEDANKNTVCHNQLIDFGGFQTTANSQLLQNFTNHSAGQFGNTYCNNNLAEIPAAPSGNLQGMGFGTNGTYSREFATGNTVEGVSNGISTNTVISLTESAYTNNIFNNVGTGISVTANAANTKVGLAIEANVMNGAGATSGGASGAGIEVTNLAKVNVQANVISNFANQGIKASGTVEANLSNNEINNIGQAGATNAQGIDVKASAQGNAFANKLENNSVTDNAGNSPTGTAQLQAAYKLEAGAINTHLCNNKSSGTQIRSAGLIDSGTGTTDCDAQTYANKVVLPYPQPAAPTLAVTCSASCAQTYTYAVVSVSDSPGNPRSKGSATVSTAAGSPNGALNGTTDFITINPSITTIGDHCDYYRTVSPYPTTGMIGSGVCGLPFTDNGKVGDNAGLPGGTNNGLLRSAVVTADEGTVCSNGELALSAGWQSTGSATVTAVRGTGQTCDWTITTGTTTAANPTVTDTLTNSLPLATTVCEMNIHGGTHTAAAGEGFQQTTLSSSAPVFTFQGTPTAGGTTYFVTRRCGP